MDCNVLLSVARNKLLQSREISISSNPAVYVLIKRTPSLDCFREAALGEITGSPCPTPRSLHFQRTIVKHDTIDRTL